MDILKFISFSNDLSFSVNIELLFIRSSLPFIFHTVCVKIVAICTPPMQVDFTFFLNTYMEHTLVNILMNSQLLSLQERLGEFYNILLIYISMAGVKVQEFEAFIFCLLSIFCCDYMYSSSSNLSISFHLSVFYFSINGKPMF